MIEKRRTRSGESRYEVRLRGVDGKERSLTLRTKKAAERYERAQQTDMDQGLCVDPRSGRVTLGTCLGASTPVTCTFVVAGSGVDPVTPRFSGGSEGSRADCC